jgi:hypothetical protein
MSWSREQKIATALLWKRDKTGRNVNAKGCVGPFEVLIRTEMACGLK